MRVKMFGKVQRCWNLFREWRTLALLGSAAREIDHETWPAGPEPMRTTVVVSTSKSPIMLAVLNKTHDETCTLAHARVWRSASSPGP